MLRGFTRLITTLQYQSGEKMHKFTAPYDLPKRVKLLADMLAPSKAGTYTSTFELAGDHGAFCSLPLTLRVQ